MGVTSRGVFMRLELSSQWVVFLSYENWRGPLTINLVSKGNGRHQHIFGSQQVGAPVRISPGHMVFPGSDVTIQTDQAQTWQAPSLPQMLLPSAERRARLAEVARLLLEGRQERGLGRLLMPILGLGAGPGQVSDGPGPTVGGCAHADGDLPILIRLRDALQRRHLSLVIEGLEALLGSGSGLTPGGDDLAIGLLLALSRWGHGLETDLDVTALAAALLPMAYQKTTLLSANLIECASLGQADERLLLALDGLVSETHGAMACAAALAAWGSSSGVDALTGMAMVL